MEQTLTLVLWFVYSFAVYTVLRQFDEISTRRLAEEIDLQRYEVNPTVVWLTKRLSLKQTFILTWLVIGVFVGVLDAVSEQLHAFGVPFFALIFGFSHIFAAAHNTKVYNQLKRMSLQEFEEIQTRRLQELSDATLLKRVKLVFSGNPVAFLVAVLAPFTLTGLFLSMAAANSLLDGHRQLVNYLLLINFTIPFIMAFIIVQISFVIGPFILSNRYYRNKQNGKVSKVPIQGMATSLTLELSVAHIEEALNDARARGAETVKISAELPVGTARE